MNQIIRVPIAGANVGRAGETLFTVVGSCIAIMLYDKERMLGGMVHIMLGYAKDRKDNPAKYADTGIPLLLKMMQEAGAAPHRLGRAKISGGGEMFDVLNKEDSVSRNNIKEVKELLGQHNIQIIASDCGGKAGRRISFDVSTGHVLVSMQDRQDILL
ncbi:MAG: chemotaxis protein CheD [SAR324 cluster bacterium]|nr:chemotaxis protein CheD [SAR324 cluster bacterium]